MYVPVSSPLRPLTRSCYEQIRVFLVTAKYCTRAVWEDDRKRLVNSLYSGGLLTFLVGYVRSWWYALICFHALCVQLTNGLRHFETTYRPIILMETWMDFEANMVKFKAWMRGLILVGGFSGAHKAAAGLA